LYRYLDGPTCHSKACYVVPESPRRTKSESNVIDLISSTPEKYEDLVAAKDHYRQTVRGATSDIKKMKKIKVENTPATIEHLNATRAANLAKATALKEKQERNVFLSVELKLDTVDKKHKALQQVCVEWI